MRRANSVSNPSSADRTPQGHHGKALIGGSQSWVLFDGGCGIGNIIPKSDYEKLREREPVDVMGVFRGEKISCGCANKTDLVLGDFTYINLVFENIDSDQTMKVWVKAFISDAVEDFILGEPDQVRIGALNSEHIDLGRGFKIARGDFVPPAAETGKTVGNFHQVVFRPRPGALQTGKVYEVSGNGILGGLVSGDDEEL